MQYIWNLQSEQDDGGMFRHKDQQRDELYRGESIKSTLCHHKDFYTWYIFVMQFYLLYCKDRSWNKITDKTYFSLVILGLRLCQRDLVWRSWCHRLQWHHKKIFTTQVWCAFALVSIWFGSVWFGFASVWFCTHHKDIFKKILQKLPI